MQVLVPEGYSSKRKFIRHVLTNESGSSANAFVAETSRQSLLLARALVEGPSAQYRRSLLALLEEHYRRSLLLARALVEDIPAKPARCTRW